MYIHVLCELFVYLFDEDVCKTATNKIITIIYVFISPIHRFWKYFYYRTFCGLIGNIKRDINVLLENYEILQYFTQKNYLLFAFDATINTRICDINCTDIYLQMHLFIYSMVANCLPLQIRMWLNDLYTFQVTLKSFKILAKKKP